MPKKRKTKPDEWPKRTELTVGDYQVAVIWWNLHIDVEVKPTLNPRNDGPIIVQKGWFNVGAGTPDVTVMLFPYFSHRTGQAEITALLDWFKAAQSIGLSLDTVILTGDDFRRGVTVAMAACLLRAQTPVGASAEGRLECVPLEVDG